MKEIVIFIGIFSVIFVVPVSGIRLTFSKETVVKQPGTTVLTCAVDESDVGQIFIMQIKAYIGNTMQQLGKVDGNGPISTIPPAMADRMVVAGSIDKTTPTNSQMTLTIDTEKVMCSDGSIYSCEISYLTNSVTNPDTKKGSHNGTLAVFVNPEMSSLEAKHNGENIEAPTPDKKAIFKVGDHLELKCTANVGSIRSTSIQWRRTTEIGREDLWNEYQPPQGTYTETEAVADGHCGFTRTSTINYNMTAADANRQNNLAFECYVFVSTPPYSNFRTDNNPRFYIDVGGGTGGNTQQVASAGSGQAGAIAGGVIGGIVFIVLIVLLVYFLWYRRRGTGEDYKTKEDNTEANRAPPIDPYSTVDKSKKYGKGGHANDALDEPHETRKPRDRDGERGRERNGPGKANYGMDRDDDDDDDYHSRDGSPTMGGPRGISHMGMDPVDGSIEKPGRHETRRKGVE